VVTSASANTGAARPGVRRFVFSFVIGLLIAFAAFRAITRQNPGEGPALYRFDFGPVLQGETLTHVFTLGNQSERPVSLAGLKTNCGCLKADMPAERAVPPGGERQLAITWETAGQSGAETKAVRVEAEGTQGAWAVCQVSARISKPYGLQPRRLLLHQVEHGRQHTASALLRLEDGAQLGPGVSLGGKVDGLRWDIERLPSASDPSGATWRLDVVLPADAPLGGFRGQFVLPVQWSDRQVLLHMPVEGSVVEPTPGPSASAGPRGAPRRVASVARRVRLPGA
jgi:hypothetical protein